MLDGVTSQGSMFPYDPDTIAQLSKSFDSVTGKLFACDDVSTLTCFSTADEVNPQGTFIACTLSIPRLR